jgi:hypothetical protein
MGCCQVPYAPASEQSRVFLRLNNEYPHSWRAIHILAGRCRCSLHIAQHIASRGPLIGLHESVVLVGADRQISEVIRSCKVPLTYITPAQGRDEFHVESTPYLILLGPEDSVRYTGGYTADRNARTGYQDGAIWRTVSSGGTYTPLPIFGCAIPDRAERSFDALERKFTF